MKKLLLGLLILLPSLAMAENIPAGCYVADYYRTDDCWFPYDPNNLTWTYYGDWTSNVAAYGSTVAILMNTEAYYERQVSINASALNTASAIIAKDSKLIKKLRKACGSRCSRIR